MLKTPVKYAWPFILGAIIGFIAAKVIPNITSFSLSKELSLTELLGLVVTIFFGVYIANVVQRKQTVDRIEQDLLIEEIKRIKLGLSGIEFDNTELSLPETVKKFKLLRMSVYELRGMLGEMEINEFDSLIGNIDKRLSSLNRSVTKREVQNDFIILTGTDSSIYTMEQRLILKILTRLVIKINRLTL